MAAEHSLSRPLLGVGCLHVCPHEKSDHAQCELGAVRYTTSS